ncbi:hypothetical protein [Nocardia sp. NBC_00511]|uniref:DUF6630 family protein n=1 Tax=Nocardia sp. NBC_00511 TaxID=2903591 RepID=UPI0030E525FD
MEVDFGREAFVEIAKFLVSDRTDIAQAVQQQLTDDDALEELLIRLEQAELVVCRVARENPDTVVALLANLPEAPLRFPVGWFEVFRSYTEGFDRGTTMEVLLGLIGELSCEAGVVLVNIDTQGDDYALTFMPGDVGDRFFAIAPGYLSPMRLDPGVAIALSAATNSVQRTDVHFSYKVIGLEDPDAAFEVLQEVDSFYERTLAGWWVSGSTDHSDSGYVALGDTESTPLSVVDFDRWRSGFEDALRQTVSSFAPAAEVCVTWEPVVPRSA